MNRSALMVLLAAATLGGCSSSASTPPASGQSPPAAASSPAPIDPGTAKVSTPTVPRQIPINACDAAAVFVKEVGVETSNLGLSLQETAATDDASAIAGIASKYLGTVAADAHKAAAHLLAQHPKSADQVQARAVVLDALHNLHDDFDTARSSVEAADPQSENFGETLKKIADTLQDDVATIGGRLRQQPILLRTCPALSKH